MALTKVTYSMIAGSPANVLDFGADSTGTIDSTSAIQAAYDSGAKSVYFPSGTYLVKQCTITSAIEIYGDGQSTIIKVPDGTDYAPTVPASGNLYAAPFIISGTVSNIIDGLIIRDLVIDGNKANLNYTVSGYVGDGTAHNIAISGGNTTLYVKNVQLLNVYSKNAGTDCMKTAGVENFRITNCTFQAGRRQGISFTGVHRKVQITDCNFLDITGGISPMAGIDFEVNGTSPVEEVFVKGCVFWNCYRGIIITNYASNINIDSCTFIEHEYTLGGISVESYPNVNNVTINNCSFTTSYDSRSIWANDPYNLIITNNRFFNTPNLTSTSADISITGTASNCVVNNNVFSVIHAAISGAFTQSVISGNIINGSNYTYATIISGGNNIYSNNIINSSTTNSWRFFSDQSQSVFANNCYDKVISYHSSFTPFGTWLGNQGPDSVGMSQSSAIPTTGTWAVGDVVWNTSPSSGQPAGWMCTVAGTPGTWKAMANLA